MSSLSQKKTVIIPPEAGLRLAVGGYAEAAACHLQTALFRGVSLIKRGGLPLRSSLRDLSVLCGEALQTANCQLVAVRLSPSP